MKKKYAILKKSISAVLAALMIAACLVLSSCSSGSDVDSVKKKGKLVVGITDFAPLDYEENGKWIGFDAEMAEAFAASLGVKAEFVVIEWDSKVTELNNKTIDCVWNGMTLTDGVKAAMDTSNPYMNNSQVVVVKSAVAEQYKTVESIKSLRFAVEKGSAGEEVLTELGITPVQLETQSAALLEVESGTSDACVIDLLMAGAMIGEGTSYPDLTWTLKLNDEQYGVGFRKGSDLVSALNDFFKSATATGKTAQIAAKYKVTDTLAG